jgi:hypothetical protein
LKLVVFYHLWVPNSYNSGLFLIDEQLKRIVKTGLLDIAVLQIVVSGNYDDKIIQFLAQYQNSKVIIIYASDEENMLYEGATLKRLYDHCKLNPADKVLYFHTKGISHLSKPDLGGERWTAINSWRHFLEWGCIDLWKLQVEKLETHDVAGVNYTIWPWPHLSGNFWWANASYISRLPNPCLPPVEMDSRDIGNNDRLNHEKWIGLAYPKVYSHANAPACYDLPEAEFNIENRIDGEPDWFWLYRDDFYPHLIKAMNKTEHTPEQKTSITVIILHDESVDLLKTIDSLNKQTCYEWDCVLLTVKDFHDNEIEIKTGLKSPLIIKSEDISPGTINSVIENNATGDLIMVIESGIELSPDYLAECLIELRTQPGSVIAFGTLMGDVTEKISSKKQFGQLHLLARNMVSTPAMFRKKDWQEIGGFATDAENEWFFWDFSVRISSNGKIGMQLPFCVTNTEQFNDTGFDSSVQMFRRHNELTDNKKPTELILENNLLHHQVSNLNKQIANPETVYGFSNLIRLIFRKIKNKIGI